MNIRFLTLLFFLFIFGCSPDRTSDARDDNRTTLLTLTIPANPADINPKIYGQMFEDFNDLVIYDVIVGRNGEARPHVDKLLKPLQIPIMRWPGGTFIHEYRWERGIGPADQRPVVDVQC